MSQSSYVDAAVAGSDLQQLAAAVQLAADPRAPNVSVDHHREVERNTAVSGVGREFSCEVVRQFDLHPAIAGVNQPAAGHLRSRTRCELDVAVSAAQVY